MYLHKTLFACSIFLAFSNIHCSYTTEVIKNTLDPVWRPFTLKSSQLAASPDSNFRMNVIDWDNVGSHDPIGHIIITPKVLAFS
jgi:Ca2+-dependent lipid-binding protein